MKSETPETLKAHLFICCREREGKPSCGSKGAHQLVRDLKIWAKSAPETACSVRISSSSCLGRCQDGIAACIYPKNLWLTDVSSEDKSAIQALLTELSKS